MATNLISFEKADEPNSWRKRPSLASSHFSFALHPQLESVIHLNTTCWKLQVK